MRVYRAICVSIGDTCPIKVWGNHKGLPLRINDRRGNPLWLPPIRYGLTATRYSIEYSVPFRVLKLLDNGFSRWRGGIYF